MKRVPRRIVGGLDMYSLGSNPWTKRFCSEGMMYTDNEEVEHVGLSGNVGVKIFVLCGSWLVSCSAGNRGELGGRSSCWLLCFRFWE